ncbi:hypothetical protein ACFX5D_15185 [Flavobacterium sp. LB3P45]|uniref:Uncharacterized protein n=1 Tax=Flavobacterium fructosi TaxID=3230416 RepID=A0ABW6HS30_9FLAO
MTKKTIKHASADVGLIFIAYNLHRVFNLIDQNLLKQYLKVLALYFAVLTPVFNAFTDCFILIFINRLFSERISIVV